MKNIIAVTFAMFVYALPLVGIAKEEPINPDQRFSSFVLQSKKLAYGGFCNINNRLECISGDRIDFSENCEEKVKPFVDKCFSSYEKELRGFIQRIDNKDFLANAQLPVFVGGTLLPCVEKTISIAQGKNEEYASKCFSRKLNALKREELDKRQELQNKTNSSCRLVDTPRDLKEIYRTRKKPTYLFVIGGWSPASRDEYDKFVKHDLFKSTMAAYQCFRVDVSKHGDEMLGQMDLWGVPALVVIDQNQTLLRESGSYSDRISEIIGKLK